jgi:ectoine hydroxylase-related dioxygenase (phytanoyl-CoA dioxygenase family)
MVELQHIEATSVDKILDALATDGACIARNALTTDVCERLVDDFRPHLDSSQWGVDEIGYKDDFFGGKTKRLHGLFSKSTLMSDVLLNPLMLSLTHKLLKETGVASDVRLSNAELMVLGSDQGVKSFHADAGSWHRAQQAETRELLISVNYALTDFTETNGATRVVPGSHLWSNDREPGEDEVCLAIMPRGSALIYSGKAIHSGGANQEGDIRIGLYLGYIASWLRPIENHLVTNRVEDIQALSEEAQRLLDVSPGGITIYA